MRKYLFVVALFSLCLWCAVWSFAAEGAFVPMSICGISAGLIGILMAFAFLDSDLGRPLTVDELKKREIYILEGKGQFAIKGGEIEKISFVRRGSRPVIAVKLPVDLPEDTGYFCVVQDFDELGSPKRCRGAIIIQRAGANSTEKISFPWKPKP